MGRGLTKRRRLFSANQANEVWNIPGIRSNAKRRLAAKTEDKEPFVDGDHADIFPAETEKPRGGILHFVRQGLGLPVNTESD